MKLNVVSSLKYNLNATKIKKIQFKDDIIDIDWNISSHTQSKLNKNIEPKPSCIKVDNTYKQNIDVKTFNSLVKCNTHVNRFSL